jgi:ABC-type sulfate transport system permease component
VAATRAPLLARAMRTGLRRSRPALADAAISLGASLVDARRLARAGWMGASAGSLALTFALTMTNLAPALVLEPTIESRTTLPGLLILSEQPGDGRHRASVLASWAIVLNLTALAIAARGEENFGGGLRV